MTRIIKVLSAVALAAIGQTLFAYNGGYENSLTTDTVIGGVTYKGYGNNTVTKRTESGTTIAANSYAQCSKLTSVNLAGVTSLGNAAFAYSALTSVELPATLKSIGYIPFGGCKSLASVTINSTAFMTSTDEAKEPFRDCTALKTVTAKCAPPTWDFKKVFPAVTTVKVPQANLSAWQAKKYAGVTIALSESTYTVRFNRNAGGSETSTQAFAVGKEVSLPWMNSGLGWANPSGKSPLGWATSATATIAVYENGGKVKDLAAAGKTVDLHMVWRDANTYVVRFHRNQSASDAVIALQALVSGQSRTLAWKDSQLGWANPSGKTFLGWSKSSTATAATWANGQSVKDLAATSATVDLYAVWGGSVAKSVSTAQVAFQAVPKETIPEAFEPGYYRGEFADGSGTFDLVVDEDGAAFFRAETEDGVWSAECEAEAVGDALVLTFEDVAPLVIRCVEGQCWAEAAERCP